jgi:hypothetical protein
LTQFFGYYDGCYVCLLWFGGLGRILLVALSGHAGNVHRWQSGGEHSEIHFLYEFRTRFGNHHLQIGLLLRVRNCGRSACRLVEYHHLGDEDLDVSDVRQTATYAERAKVLVGVAHIIGLVIILRKEF